MCTDITYNHLLWSLFLTQNIPRCLKTFCFSQKKKPRRDLEHMPGDTSCLLCYNNGWCPEDFALLAEHEHAFGTCLCASPAGSEQRLHFVKHQAACST